MRSVVSFVSKPQEKCQKKDPNLKVRISELENAKAKNKAYCSLLSLLTASAVGYATVQGIIYLDTVSM